MQAGSPVVLSPELDPLLSPVVFAAVVVVSGGRPVSSWPVPLVSGSLGLSVVAGPVVVVGALVGSTVGSTVVGPWLVGVAVAALVVPGSELTIENVGLNPTRAGLIEVLKQMGGDITLLYPREVGGEPVADLLVKHSALKGIEVDPAVAPSMIDEFPVLFVAAALAQGTTVTTGLDELRVKESDRLAVMAAALTAAGAQISEQEDGLTIVGTGGDPLPGTAAAIATHLDHRIAMAMAVAGLASKHGVEVDDTRPIATSFPVFETLLDGLAG